MSRPDLFDTYAIQRPSGEKRGALSSNDELKNGRARRSPSIGRSQMSRPGAGRRSTNASIRPSGDHEPGSCGLSLAASRSREPCSTIRVQNMFGAPLVAELNVALWPSGVQIGNGVPTALVTWVSVPTVRSWSHTSSLAPAIVTSNFRPSGDTRGPIIGLQHVVQNSDGCAGHLQGRRIKGHSQNGAAARIDQVPGRQVMRIGASLNEHGPLA